MFAYKLTRTDKIHEENGGKWTVCYTDLADILNDFETLNKAC